MTRAGQYDTPATFERPVAGVDPVYGTETITWAPLSALPGSPTVAERFMVRALDVLQGRSEAVTMNVALSRGRSVIRMRYRSDITSAMRVTLHRDTDETFQIITDPAMVGRKEELELVLEKYSS